MRTLLVGGGLLLAAGAGAAVIGAQHTAPVRHIPHQICGSVSSTGGHETAASDHAAVLAARLELTSEQRATVERLSTEACAAMARYHEQILAVLTSEQRDRPSELHDRESGLHAWFRKLHERR